MSTSSKILLGIVGIAIFSIAKSRFENYNYEKNLDINIIKLRSSVFNKSYYSDLKSKPSNIKLIVFEKLNDEKFINEDVMTLLPNYLISRSIDEINTIVLIKHGENIEGHYSNGRTAYERYITISFINYKKGTSFGSAKLFGGVKGVISDDETGYGNYVSDEVLKAEILRVLN